MRRVSLCLLLMGCEKTSGDKLTLRFHPPTGAVYHHTFEQHTRVTAPPVLFGGGRQEMNMRVFSTQTVNGPVPDGIEIAIVADSASMTLPSIPSDTISRYLDAVRGLRNTIVYDARSQVVRHAFSSLPPPGLASQLAYTLQGPEYAFPDRPMGRGDSWTVTGPLPLKEFLASVVSSGDSAQTTLTVRDVRLAGGDTVVVLDVKTTFPTAPIRLTIAGLRASMRLSGDIGGHQEFSITRGTVVAADIHSEMTFHVTIPTLGVRDAPTKSTNRSTIRLAGAQ